jgi:hypothetical protein
MLTLLTSDRSTKKDVQRWTATPIKRAAVDKRFGVTRRHQYVSPVPNWLAVPTRRELGLDDD